MVSVRRTRRLLKEHGPVGLTVATYTHGREAALKQLFRNNDISARMYEPIARRREIPNPFRVYWTDPEDVGYLLALPDDSGFDNSGGEGRFDKYRPGVVGGDWDQYLLDISEIPLYEGLRQRLMEGASWEETSLHPDRYTPRHPSRESTRYASYSDEAFRERTAELDRIGESLRTDGFLPQSDLDGGQFKDELTLAVGRDGRLIRNSAGLHRLIYAQLLGLDRIPARVLVVHEDAPAVSDLPLNRDRRLDG
jgi:hypothetical protein